VVMGQQTNTNWGRYIFRTRLYGSADQLSFASGRKPSASSVGTFSQT
jgi:hypothetical protein